jgi:hypothetical protein
LFLAPNGTKQQSAKEAQLFFPLLEMGLGFGFWDDGFGFFTKFSFLEVKYNFVFELLAKSLVYKQWS